MKVKSQKGFTLIEVMVALGILATALVVLLGLRNRDSALHQYSGELLEATLLVKEKMADQELSGFPELGEYRGNFGEEKSRFSWKENVIPTPFDSVREVRVTVSWDRGNRKENVGLTSYFFKKE
ncbi:MAG TPA: prepilin-type N-terminal cleavage/methylation domain-containing protein [Nitrospiria bacterium]